MAPTGIFICRLPDEATGLGKNLYIGVYDDAGEGVLAAKLYAQETAYNNLTPPFCLYNYSLEHHFNQGSLSVAG